MSFACQLYPPSSLLVRSTKPHTRLSGQLIFLEFPTPPHEEKWKKEKKGMKGEESVEMMDSDKVYDRESNKVL